MVENRGAGGGDRGEQVLCVVGGGGETNTGEEAKRGERRPRGEHAERWM